jgi:hypothetical protein
MIITRERSADFGGVAVLLAGGTPARAGGTPALPRNIERICGILRNSPEIGSACAGMGKDGMNETDQRSG